MPTPVMMSTIMMLRGSTSTERSSEVPPMEIHWYRPDTKVRSLGALPSMVKKMTRASTNAVAMLPMPMSRVTARGGSPGHEASTIPPSSGSRRMNHARVVATG